MEKRTEALKCTAEEYKRTVTLNNVTSDLQRAETNNDAKYRKQHPFLKATKSQISLLSPVNKNLWGTIARVLCLLHCVQVTLVTSDHQAQELTLVNTRM